MILWSGRGSLDGSPQGRGEDGGGQICIEMGWAAEILERGCRVPSQAPFPRPSESGRRPSEQEVVQGWRVDPEL